MIVRKIDSTGANPASPPIAAAWRNLRTDPMIALSCQSVCTPNQVQTYLNYYMHGEPEATWTGHVNAYTVGDWESSPQGSP